MTRPLTILAALALAACSGGEATEVTPTPEPVEVPEVAPEPTAEDAAADDEAAEAALVPSPSETQRALEAAGIDVTLASLIDHPNLSMSSDSEDQLAVGVGVVVADMLLTAKTSTKEQLVEQIQTISTGMKQLEGGSDIEAVLADLEERVNTDAITRDELVAELEMLSAAVIPELEFNGRARIVPLIQAGSWLEASHLLARALQQAGQLGAADALLKQPEVVSYFQRYASDNTLDTPAPISATLVTSLATLSELSNKEGALTMDDMAAVEAATRAVLALL